jgi:hypothetical protein
MKFRYIVDGKEVPELSEKERMIWSLDAMQKASVSREKYYKSHDVLLGPIEKYNPQHHQDNDLLQLIVVDLIFTLVRSIEAFMGAVGVCWKISTDKEPIEKLHRRLLRPGENTQDEIKDILSNKEIDRKTLCKLCGFPIPETMNIERKYQIVLNEVYDQTLKRMKTYGFFAYWYLNEFKEVRHVYAHNMRILFLKSLQHDTADEIEKASMIGILGTEELGPSYLILLCESQRRAMGELVVRLCQFEQILYENIKFYIWNDCTPVPPVSGVYIPERFQEELRQIKIALGYDWFIPSIRIEMSDKDSLEQQYQLHSDFLHLISKLGYRR